MQHHYTFLIDSDPSGHRLSVNGDEIGRFATLDAAEAEAARVAERILPGANLNFELDFKWTLSDLETRVAMLECDIAEPLARQ